MYDIENLEPILTCDKNEHTSAMFVIPVDIGSRYFG